MSTTLKPLLLRVAKNFFLGVLVLGAIIFLLAGTLNYWQGWVFVILWMGLLAHQAFYLSLKDPALLERRKNIAPEGESTAQKIMLLLALLSLVGQLVFSALDYRFGWSHMPALVSLFGDFMIVISFIAYYLVFHANSYAATSVKIFEGQKVISIGPYAWIRHPKYAGDLFLVVGMPIALGSWWSLAFILFTIPGLVWRIRDEEKLLGKDLPGYTEYAEKVRYRLIPYLW